MYGVSEYNILYTYRITTITTLLHNIIASIYYNIKYTHTLDNTVYV